MRRRVPQDKSNRKKTNSKKSNPRRSLDGKPARLQRKELSFLIDSLQAEENSERTWREMTSDEPDDLDIWGAVEEHLLHKPHEHNHKLRRWKYFGK